MNGLAVCGRPHKKDILDMMVGLTLLDVRKNKPSQAQVLSLCMNMYQLVSFERSTLKESDDC